MVMVRHTAMDFKRELTLLLAAYFAPAIIQGLGHSSIQSQLLSVPPYACAFVLSMTVAFVSDYIQHRFLFTIAAMAISVSGFIILLVTEHSTNLKYAALFLAAAGTYTAMPVAVCWFSTNCECHPLARQCLKC